MAVGSLAQSVFDAEEHGVPIVLIEHEDLDAKDFAAEPRLMKLPAAAGILELVKKMPASQKFCSSHAVAPILKNLAREVMMARMNTPQTTFIALVPLISRMSR